VETCFVVNTKAYVLKRQLFSHSSTPGTYTLSVPRTPNQTDSDVVHDLFQIVRSRENHKRDWKTIRV